MAYAAVMSLMYTIKGLVDSSHIPVDSSTREILLSAFDHALSLQRTLEKCSVGEEDMEKQIFIIEAAHKLEDAIEFPLLSQPPTFFSNLHHHVDFFVRTATERKEIIQGLWEQKAAEIIEEDVEELFVQNPSKPDQEEEEEEDIEMVGLCDQFLQIRDYLLANKRDNIWNSGMAGIGKTRLAKKILDDPLVKTNFQRLAFVRVGKKCRSIQRVLQAIIDQVSHDDGGMSILEDGDLLQSFHKIFSVKSLIVLDDVWDVFTIDQLQSETSGNEIKFLVTSRTDVAFPPYWALKIRFMNVEESWELLRKKVFGKEEECPSQLVKPGKKIAEKCEGLPLLINNVAFILLSTIQKDPESWNRVAEKPDSILEEASYQISEVLLSSYHEIDEIEKICFLFMAAFPRCSIVSCSTTINLWRVEGFSSFFSENAFAREKSFIMINLLGRNLVVGHQQRWNGSHTAYNLHSSYWYLSKRIAQNNKFLYIIKSISDDLDESIKSHRLLAIQENVLLAIKEVHDKIASILTVRSLLCTGPYLQYQVPICWEWKLLKVLHVLTVRFYEFPIEVVKLIRLRYLSLTCNANLPPSISKLCNLEFLIVHQHLSIKRVAVVSYVPVEIWDLQQLKHLEIIGKNLPDPRPGAVLPNLTKLLNVGVESCTKGVLESIPKLKKLRIQIELGPDDAQTLSFFDHISSLEKLKSFQIIILNSTLLRPPPPLSMFTSSLQKLSLSGFGYSWADMTKTVELTQLKVLKLKCYAFRGEKWEAKGMVFERLRYLLIEDTDLREWTADQYETFPWLQRLTMKNCHKLQEIPLFSSNFKHCIELVDCNPLAETCAKQRYSTEERVTVTASYSWKGKKLKP